MGSGSTGSISCKSDCTRDISKCSAAITCGDGKKTGNEACDGGDLGGASCASVLGVGATGTISCANDCKSLVISGCQGGSAKLSCLWQPAICGPSGNQDCGKACGPNQNEDCCQSPLVDGGAFKIAYDGSPGLTDGSHLATVSTFRLDRYEVTVGRFRKFVDAVVGGWKPAIGSGLHSHLPGGKIADGPETGWDATWNVHIPNSKSTWDKNLGSDSAFGTWTVDAETQENRSINFVNWFELYAFCIWDGGFLPTEAEWNYAASGGSEQRYYPWSNPPGSMSIDGTFASYDCNSQGGCSVDDIRVPGSYSTKGDGRWTQTDLGGNLYEWNLDWYATLKNQCSNCANVSEGNIARVVRGGDFSNKAVALRAGSHDGNWKEPESRTHRIGGRCARTPLLRQHRPGCCVV